MIGCIGYVRQRGRMIICQETVGGLPMLKAVLHEPKSLSSWMMFRRIQTMEGIFQAYGVRKVIIGENFPYESRLVQWKRVDVPSFYRSIADLFVLELLHWKGISPDRAIVAISGHRICPELHAAAKRLCLQVKGMIIDVPVEGERYAAWLHQMYGLPVRAAGGRDVTLAFGPTSGESDSLISLYEKNLCLGGLEVSAAEMEIPDGYGDQFLAALWECGRLNRKSLRVGWRKPLDKSMQSQYNS